MFEGVRMGKHVLLIDDNEDLVEGLAELMEIHGHDVDVALTGVDGLAAFRGKPYDSVFIDIRLPDFDGVDLAKRIIDGGATARIVLMTGYGGPDLPARVAELSGVELLFKPLDPDVVLRRVE
jgi:DNA-binding response OmpR family regulator